MESARTPNRHHTGPGRVTLPVGQGRDYSAWHRTADSLVRRGLLVSTGTYNKVLPEYVDAPGYWELWDELTEPQQRLLLGLPSRAKPSNAMLWNDDGSLSPIGEQVRWRAENWWHAKD